MNAIKSLANQAKALGAAAFASGVKCAPCLDVNYADLTKDHASWSDEDCKIRQAAGKAWIAGWTQASLA